MIAFKPYGISQIRRIRGLLALFFLAFTSLTASPNRFVVDPSGKGDFTTITEALNSLPDSANTPSTIFIRKGLYAEKLFITKHQVIFEGEDRDSTIISQSIARDEWRCKHANDWGVATINIEANDISFVNLTIANTFGFENKAPYEVTCPMDSLHSTKKITKNSHQMALRSFGATRLKVIHCVLKAFGGDTVSPWNVSAGMFYFKDCVMEGGVDFYCPRGWAYAEDCRFISHSGSAAIWHDGSGNRDAKTVLKRCSFEGFDGFNLGRYHKDAQFFLLECLFADNMSDTPIYRVPTQNIIQWGERIYYQDCTRKAGNYGWFADNLPVDGSTPPPHKMDLAWTFNGRWNPEAEWQQWQNVQIN